MSTIEIGGASVEIDDPCALLDALRKAYYRLVAGEAEVEVKYGSKSARFAVLGNQMSELRAAMADLEARCMAKNGIRRRGARTIRWR